MMHAHFRADAALATRASSRRGIALLLVLSVIAVASILGWSMLSAASLRARVDVNAQDATKAKLLADSGVSYGLYYLRYPEKSPVALTAGPYNTFYAGQSGLTLWQGSGGVVNVSITNTAYNTFTVRSTALVNGLAQTIESDTVISTAGYVVDSAAAFGGPIQLPSSVTFSGLVSTAATVKDSLGNTLSSLGGYPIAVKTDAVPAFSDLQLVTETGVPASTGGTDRTYTIGGVTYVAEKAPATITGTLTTARPALNPGNVWYSDATVTLNGATLVGTLIVRKAAKDLIVQGTNSITSKSASLPALVVGNEMQLSHAAINAARISVTGVTYVGNKITTTGTTMMTTGLTFQGAIIMSGSTPTIEGATGPINITKTAPVANVKLTKDTKVTGLALSRWSRTD